MRPFRYFLLAGFSIAAFVWTTNGVAMSLLLKEQEVVVASPLSGILTKNLQPLRNTKLIRRLDWGDGEVVDEVCTNDEGFFEFSGRREKLKLSPLAEFVVSQKIVALDDEEETLLRSEEHTSELQSRGHLVSRLLL